MPRHPGAMSRSFHYSNVPRWNTAQNSRPLHTQTAKQEESSNKFHKYNPKAHRAYSDVVYGKNLDKEIDMADKRAKVRECLLFTIPNIKENQNLFVEKYVHSHEVFDKVVDEIGRNSFHMEHEIEILP